jgi:hypothetical protein
METRGNRPVSPTKEDRRHCHKRNEAFLPHGKVYALIPALLHPLLLAVAIMVGPELVMAQSVGNLRLDSFVQRDLEVELGLGFPTLWGRRYRVETSTNLLQWETTTITDAMRGPSATISVKGSASESRFYRVSAFDWEELRSELRVARELWRTRGPSTYRFEFRWNCYCLPNLREWVRVDVRDKILVGVTRLTDGEALPPDRWSHRTVEGMFQWLEGKLAEHPEVLRVRFDSELGYPVEGYCDISSMMADEEMGFELKSVLPP